MHSNAQDLLIFTDKKSIRFSLGFKINEVQTKEFYTQDWHWSLYVLLMVK